MFRNLIDFEKSWKEEQTNTLKIFANISDDILRSKKVHADIRSLERLCWHITQTIPEMGHRAGLFDKDPLENLPVPESMEEIAAAYSRYSEEILDLVKTKWTDKDLGDYIHMYGESWQKGKILSLLLHHEIHHRAQMTVLMRLLGIPVPGLYGPSKEEWSSMGMPSME